ncbi:NAD(P)-binding domain-containing protein [Tanacetum coccineum]|uniref:NAD(P)-binding domain-containing protein n=1 Tax=Tanacetum coccineum TaxID=301880 RepID=A0ABQ5AR29_9ASTR
MVTSIKEKNGATPSPHEERALYTKLHGLALGLSGHPRPSLISNGLKAKGIEGVRKPRYKARVILSLTACEHYELEQLDVKTAFLHGNLKETIYMRQPPGFEERTGNKVYLLKKSLYGLKQSPRQWYKLFYVYMISNGFSRNNYDSCVYFKKFAPGSLMYLMVCTRPNIAYAVSIVSRYLANLGLVYGRDQGKHMDVDGFVDAYYAKDPDKYRSITGCVFMAEYMVLTEAVKESIWLKGLLIELGVNLRSVVVNCDNQGAIHLSRNTVFHERTKHINMRYHFILEIMESKEIEVEKIDTKDNAADAFTKVVPGWPSGGVDGVPSVRPKFDHINGSRQTLYQKEAGKKAGCSNCKCRRYEKGGIVAIVEGEAHGGLGLTRGLLGVQTQSHIGRIIISKLTYKLGGLLLLSLIGFRMEPQLGLYVRLGEMLGLGSSNISAVVVSESLFIMLVTEDCDGRGQIVYSDTPTYVTTVEMRFLSPKDITREGFHLQNCVADMVSNGGWSWPQAWLLKAPDLGLIPAPNLDESRLDITRWRDHNGNMSDLLVWIRVRGLAGMDVVPRILHDIITWLQPMARNRTARSIIERLIFAASSYYIWLERNNRLFKNTRRNTLGSFGRGGRYLSTESSKIDEPLKVEEAETINTPPPLTEKLLVLGGNGFVGSHICKEALDRGFSVASLSRSGKSSIQESWANNVSWHQGDLLSGDSWKEALDGVTSVISCVGGFGSNSHMFKINGTANINAVNAAAEKGIRRFVYISASDFGVINYLIQGYYDGKRATEQELLTKFPYGHVILRPGFIYGTRRVGSMKLPLGVIGSPLEMVMQYTKSLNQVPIVGPLLTPPVDVKAVAKVAVRGAIDPVFPPGIVDVYGIRRYSQQKAF